LTGARTRGNSVNFTGEEGGPAVKLAGEGTSAR
jgi:hypothetical protein